MCPFGFLVRPIDEENPLALHAYDMSANFIGVVLTDTISCNRIRRCDHLGHDLYAFQFENDLKSVQLIRCNFLNII
jgi:hypothetical protein